MSADRRMLEGAGWKIASKKKQGMHWIIDWRDPLTREFYRQGVAVGIERSRRRLRLILAEAEQFPDYPTDRLEYLKRGIRLFANPDFLRIFEEGHCQWMQTNGHSSKLRKPKCQTQSTLSSNN